MLRLLEGLVRAEDLPNLITSAMERVSAEATESASNQHERTRSAESLIWELRQNLIVSKEGREF